MNRISNFILIGGFFILIFGFLCATVLTPDRDISEVENRTLAKLPDINKNSLYSGELFRKFEEYFTDQFFARDEFVLAYTYSELMQDKVIVNNVVTGTDGWLFTPPAGELRTEKIDRTIQYLEKFMQEKPEDTKVYMSLLPRKSNILTDSIPNYFNHNYGYDNVKYFLDNRPKSLKVFDVQKHFAYNFSKAELESLYFKTDHHWNIEGAYEGYKQTIQSLDKELDDFEGQAIEREQLVKSCPEGKDFIGSLNQQIYLLYPTSDENLCTYIPSMKDIKMTAIDRLGNTATDLSQIYGTGKDKQMLRYFDIYTTDYSVINFENTNADNDIHILILKDSYANPIQPLFAQHFKKTTIVDLRYFTKKSVLSLLEEEDIDVMLMFYNNSNLFGDIYDKGLGISIE